MEFKKFKSDLQNNFQLMIKDVDNLFEVNLDKDKLWELYLNNFPEGTNEIFRERTEHDCSACRSFVKNIGNAVVIKNNVVRTIWDFTTSEEGYQPSIDAMSEFVKSQVVSDVYINKERTVGQNKNHERLENGDILTWEHLYVKLPEELVYKGVKSLGDIKGDYRDVRNVFKRSLTEITKDSVMTVLELISQNSLYKGAEWKAILTEFLKYKKAYDKLTSDSEKENYAWEKSVKAGIAIAKIKNHSIGTLLINISEGMELDIAVKKYEAIVAPSNYKRPKAVFTKKMLEDAKKKMQDLGYMESLGRRFATLDDITVNNILFSNRDSADRIGGLDIFDDMVKEMPINPKTFSRVEEITIEEFVENVLPIAEELELFLENKHSNNMVSLIAPQDKDSKTMFKWNNNFSWAYSGNIADSSMRDRVKSAGGSVDGVLRFTIQWNDIVRDNNDLDAHCKEPNGNEIYYGNKTSRNTTGALDVDIVNPKSGKPAVENITWSNKSKMQDGTYKFFAYNYSGGCKEGFRAEIEFDGQIYSFDHTLATRNHQTIQVAEVTLKDGKFTIVEKMKSSLSSREVWNVNTNQFVPVSVVMNSPNYWDKQDGIGNKHYFFMMKDCINSETPNGFYNEFLNNDLLEHKRVFEALGSKMAVVDVEDQLSGLGFSSTKRNEVLVKVKGQSERVLKIKF